MSLNIIIIGYIHYLGVYTVGKIKPFFKYYVHSDGFIFNSDGEVLKPYKNLNRNGQAYLRIKLYCGKNRKAYYVHRLVAHVFFGKIERYEIDHINVNTLDNRLCNLQKVTPKQNNKLRVKRRYYRNNKVIHYEYQTLGE